MNTASLSETLTTLCSELVDGAHVPGGAFILNSGDAGLLGSLDKLSAAEASRSSSGGATIAAHTDHVRYGVSLLNTWNPGEDPWANANWSASWEISSVTDQQWLSIRNALRDECHRMLQRLRTPLDVTPTELNAIVGTIAHIGYHLGAIRQIERNARGPKEGA